MDFPSNAVAAAAVAIAFNACREPCEIERIVRYAGLTDRPALQACATLLAAKAATVAAQADAFLAWGEAARAVALNAAHLGTLV